MPDNRALSPSKAPTTSVLHFTASKMSLLRRKQYNSIRGYISLLKPQSCRRIAALRPTLWIRASRLVWALRNITRHPRWSGNIIWPGGPTVGLTASNITTVGRDAAAATSSGDQWGWIISRARAISHLSVPSGPRTGTGCYRGSASPLILWIGML